MKKKELKRMLGIANNTVFEQINIIKELNTIVDNIPSIVDRLTKLHDGQFNVAEKEINRLNIIIHHYEDRINRIMND